MAYSDKDEPETYLIRYWKPKQYNNRVQYEVQGYVMETVLAEAKKKVPDPASYSWCIDVKQ